MSALVTIDDVTVGYGDRPILQHVSFAIARGEFTALLGPNGAGKTTLFRGILGLIPLRAGRIAWGFDRATSPPGYVPQKEALDPIFPLTAHEVVLMGATARVGPLRPIGRRRRALAEECLVRVGLEAARDEPFWALSGGQKQRVLIARALAVEPELLLLDEPTAGVDPGAEKAIIDVIRRLNREAGLTVVLVSHHLRLVAEVVESVIWVEDGGASKGPTAAVLATERVADAFGTALPRSR